MASVKYNKRKGARFEQRVAEYLSRALDDPRIERRHLKGAKDCGDISGLMHDQQRVVIECKNTTSNAQTSEFIRQAEEEAGNDDATFWAVVRKRRNIGIETDDGMASQLVIMTLRQYALLLNHGLPLNGEE